MQIGPMLNFVPEYFAILRPNKRCDTWNLILGIAVYKPVQQVYSFLQR